MTLPPEMWHHVAVMGTSTAVRWSYSDGAAFRAVCTTFRAIMETIAPMNKLKREIECAFQTFAPECRLHGYTWNCGAAGPPTLLFGLSCDGRRAVCRDHSRFDSFYDIGGASTHHTTAAQNWIVALVPSRFHAETVWVISSDGNVTKFQDGMQHASYRLPCLAQFTVVAVIEVVLDVLVISIAYHHVNTIMLVNMSRFEAGAVVDYPTESTPLILTNLTENAWATAPYGESRITLWNDDLVESAGYTWKTYEPVVCMAADKHHLVYVGKRDGRFVFRRGWYDGCGQTVPTTLTLSSASVVLTGVSQVYGITMARNHIVVISVGFCDAAGTFGAIIATATVLSAIRIRSDGPLYFAAHPLNATLAVANYHGVAFVPYLFA